jgi:hypothetical protein
MSDSDKHQDGEHLAARRCALGALNRDFVERVRAMSSRERVGFLVSAGINNADGKLTDLYRD